jgi:uncharacterized OB-fold protein
VSAFRVQVCDRCGHAVFPARTLCPRCGSREWHEEEAAGGVAQQVTTHRDGGRIASVASERGPIVIARAGEGVAAGSSVALELDGGAPVARLSA